MPWFGSEAGSTIGSQLQDLLNQASGASDKFVPTPDASGVPRGREPNLGGAVLPQGEALLAASVGREIAGLHLIELLRSQG